MARFRSMPTLGMFIIMALALAACETVNTISQRLSSLEFPSFGNALSGEGTAVANGDCPPIQVVPELSTLTEFSPMAEPGDKNLVSEVSLADITASCEGIKKGALNVEIAMTLDGKVGPRARLTPDERPTFAYPYFVALTTVKGEIVAKEIHAASMNYGKGQNTQKVTEEKTHVFALKGPGAPGEYRILVGFQLTDEQLAYNRANPAAPQEPPVRLAARDTASGAAQTMAALAPASGEAARRAPIPARKPIRKTAPHAADITEPPVD